MSMEQPKYAIGDLVFHPKAVDVALHSLCPDCCGEKEWQVKLPNGEEFAVPCSTCKRSWDPPTGAVTRFDWTGSVDLLTIGSVQYNSDGHYSGDGRKRSNFAYMCRETGVGSGRLYNQDELYADCGAAEAEAKRLAEARREEWDAQEEKLRQKEKRNAKRKPSWEARRIRELEKQLEELRRA